MNTPSDPQPVGLSARQRLLVGAVGLGLTAALALAVYLTPSPDGLGTHQQLGLPPCTFRCLFNIRCPACGMTTAWSCGVRGMWRDAVGANVGGLVLLAFAIVAAPYCLLSALRGRWLTKLPSEWVWAAGALGVAAVTLADWAVRLTTE